MAEQWLNSRKLKERIIVKAKLKLLAPTHLGNGDNHSPLDMPLIQDPYEGKALLTGSSLAGALRNYVAQRNKRCARHLFGDANESVSRESYLIVDDALGELAGVELRGGVAVDPKTGTAQENHKFDIELLPAGTVFSLRFELLVSKSKEKELKQALVIALMGLQQSEICLGKRKSRGFGKCKVDHWQVAVYDVTAPQGVIAWLEENENSFKAGSEIEKLIGVTPEIFQRDICKLKTTFILRRSILIRSDMGDVKGPDMVHLKSKRFEEKEPVPVVSGTSLAGVLRSRTVKIGNEIEPGYGYRLADSLFGWRPGYGEKQSVTASRIWVEEAEIKNPIERVQTRVKIDRFSGGALTGGLFDQQPVFSNGDAEFIMELSLLHPRKGDVGLLLLLLRDLWLGDLPVGGENNIGRGRLSGKSADLAYNGKNWEITQEQDGSLSIGGTGLPGDLNDFVTAFKKKKG